MSTFNGISIPLRRGFHRSHVAAGRPRITAGVDEDRETAAGRSNRSASQSPLTSSCARCGTLGSRSLAPSRHRHRFWSGAAKDGDRVDGDGHRAAMVPPAPSRAKPSPSAQDFRRLSAAEKTLSPCLSVVHLHGSCAGEVVSPLPSARCIEEHVEPAPCLRRRAPAPASRTMPCMGATEPPRCRDQGHHLPAARSSAAPACAAALCDASPAGRAADTRCPRRHSDRHARVELGGIRHSP